ncbi:MAG TPA: VC0807 family protein [Nitrolancea sp.]|nr:VC0807 family protein [Nitrolancea sp.]
MANMVPDAGKPPGTRGEATSADNQDERPSDRAMILRGVVWPILSDIVLPFALYSLARELGFSIVLALLVGGLWYIGRMLISVLRGTRIDRLSIFLLVLIVAGIATSLVSGSARFAVVKDSAFTGVIGIFYLVTRLSGRSVMSPAFRPLVLGKTEGGEAIWNDLWKRSAGFRRLFHRLDTVWGVGLLLEATIRIVGALLLPVSTVVNLSPVLMGVTFILLASWNGLQGKALGRLLRAEGLVPPAEQPSKRSMTS